MGVYQQGFGKKGEKRKRKLVEKKTENWENLTGQCGTLLKLDNDISKKLQKDNQNECVCGGGWRWCRKE